MYKVGDKVMIISEYNAKAYMKKGVIIEIDNPIEDDIPYLIRIDDYFTTYEGDEDLISEKIYNSPLYKAVYE